MPWSYTPYVLLLSVTIGVSAANVSVAWRRRSMAGAVPLLLLALAVIEWSLGYAAELMSTTLEAKLVWAKIQYLGIVSVPMMWLVFSLRYTDQNKWLTHRILALLAIVPLITLALVWTNDLHGLVWRESSVAASGPFADLRVTYGTWFWVQTAYSYSLLGTATLLLALSFVRSPAPYRQRDGILLLGALIPWVGNVLHLSGLGPWPYLDLTPLLFTISGLTVSWGVFRHRLLDIAPVARNAVVDGLDEGVIVLDSQHRVIDLNPAAAAVLGRTSSSAIGQVVDQIVPGWPGLAGEEDPRSRPQGEIIVGEGQAQRTYGVSTSQLRDRYGDPGGWAVVLRDTTEWKRAERELYRQALTFDNILDSVILTDMKGRIIDCNPATEEMFGYSREELLGQPSQIWHRPNETATLTGDILAGIAREGRWCGEIHYIRKDAVEGACEVVVVPLRDETGHKIAHIGVSHDITARKRAEESLMEQKQLLESLVAVARATAEQPSLEATLRNALDVMAALTGADFGSLFLVDGGGRVMPAFASLHQRAPARQQELASLAMDKGLAGWVARHHQVALIHDTAVDERWLPAPDGGYEARSALAVPIVSGSTLLGVLTLTHSEAGRFTAEHAYMLQAAADQMALAVRNAQSFEVQKRMAGRQATLYQVLTTVGEHLDPQTLARRAVETVATLAGWPAVALLLPDESANHLVIQAVEGTFPFSEGQPISADHGAAGLAFRTGQTQHVTGAEPENLHPGFSSELAVPLRRRERVLGVLMVASRQSGAFDQDDVLLAESLAEAIALALSNAHLYEETKQHAADLTTLYAVTRITGQSLTPEHVPQKVLPPVIISLGFDAGLIALFDPVQGKLRLAAGHRLSTAMLQCLQGEAWEGTLCAYVHEHRERVAIGDVEQEADPVVRGMVTRMGARLGGEEWRAWVGVPLLHHDESLGVLCLFAHQPRQPLANEMILLETISRHVATAVVNARLFQTTVDERRRLSTVLESSRDGILFVGTDGRMRVVNAHALALLGLPGEPEAWIERPLPEALMALAHRARSAARVALSEIRRIQRGDQAAGEGESEVAPRTLHWVNLPVLSDATPLGRLVVLRDVTEERQVERMRDDLIHTMVHDLRNPLTSLSMALNLLGQPQGGKLSSHQRVMLDYALGSLQRTLTLVNNILDVSRLESGRMPLECAAVSLSDLVAETLGTQTLLAAQKGLRLESDVPATLPPVWADGGVVDRVLQNLIGNACKFTPEGGLIRVTADAAVDAGNGHDTPTSHVVLAVSDTGPGIPPELQDRLFQKFVTGGQQGSGSGLGLAFCRLAVEAHNGRLWVESEPGHGTTFHLTLPVAGVDAQGDTTELQIDNLHMAAAHSGAERPG